MIETICICGAGTMGSGIAQAAATAGIRTLLYDLSPDMLDRAKNPSKQTCNALLQKTFSQQMKWKTSATIWCMLKISASARRISL